MDRLKKYREENREKYNAICLERYRIRCETEPDYQDKLAKQRRERDMKKKGIQIGEEVVLAMVPETRGTPRKYGIKKTSEPKQEAS